MSAPTIACQRWEGRRERYRPSGERIRATEYGVEPVRAAVAKRFVEAHHYSGSWPAAVEVVGLVRKLGLLRSELVGVAAFSVPPSQAVIPKWLGLPNTSGSALSRARAVLAEHDRRVSDARGQVEAAFRVVAESRSAGQGSDADPQGAVAALRAARASAALARAEVEQAAAHGLDLGRFVLAPEVAGDGESWFLARAFSLLADLRPGCRGVMATSDPLVRVAADGREVCPGHVGVIYQALGAQHVGRTSAGLIRLDAHARTVSERIFSKLRTGDQGREYAGRILAEAIGDPLPGEDVRAWVARAQRSLRTVRHPGCLVYRWAIGGGELAPLERLPYPRTATHRVTP